MTNDQTHKTVKKLKNLEEIGDYSIDLMDEISRDIHMLTKFSGKKLDNNLDEIDNKLDHARKKGLNIESLDKQVLDFRVVMFKRDVKNKMQQLEQKGNDYSTDITAIEKEFNELKNEEIVDSFALQELLNDLKNQAIRAKIKHMIQRISDSNGTSAYTIDNVAHELEKAKKKGIKVDDIEEMLFG